MKRKALGKGLHSLIPRAPEIPNNRPGEAGPRQAGYVQLDIDRIEPHRSQPRTRFEQESLEELALSIKRQGVLQPVLVRPTATGYQLVAGERRWRAAQLAGLLKIPAVIRDVEDDQVLEVALVENLQREDLNPMEAASAFHTLIEDLGLTQQAVAERVGKQRTTVANMLRLLHLPSAVQEKIRSGLLSLGHAKAVAGLESPGAQITLAERVIRDGLSVRQTEAIVAQASRSAPAFQAPKTARPDPNVAAAESELQRALKTKVRIVQKKRGGRIELHFFNNEELERVYQLLLSAMSRELPT